MKRKFKLRTKHLLFLSLIINLFLVGIMFGYVSQPKFQEKKGGWWFRNLDKLSENLPTETSEIVKAEIEILKEDNKKIFDEMKSAHQEMLKTISAENFDPEEYEEKSEELRDIRNEMSENFSDTISNIAIELNSEERKIFAKNLEKMIPQKKKWK